MCHTDTVAMNILVTGANGQLGMELRRASKGSGHNFIFTDISQVPGLETVSLDITNIDAVRITAASESVDVIVNCAAYTDVDRAESEIGLADMLNHTAVAGLARVARERKAVLIHISTDQVFHGDNHIPYTEEDTPDPLGAYGITKYAGEQSVRDSGCRHIIIRTAWLYSASGRNFVKTIAGLTRGGGPVDAVCDRIGSPTFAGDLAELIVRIIRDGMLDMTGTYHYTDEGCASWYDLAVAVCGMCGNGCEVRPVRSDQHPSGAPSPHYSVLDKSLVKERFGITIPHWTSSLKKCIEEIYEDKVTGKDSR